MYNLLLLFGALFALPKWLLQKKYRGSVLQRLGFRLPPSTDKQPVIWMHMVSMGETRAMISTYNALKKRYPQAAFYLSSVTQTGQAEAKRSLVDADHYFYLPLDLSWIMKRLVKRIQPMLLLLSESDFWRNMIQNVKKQDGKVLLLNGKISEKSATRFSKLPHFSHKLFGSIDHLLVQNSEYAKRFISLQISDKQISITGNLKQTIPLEPLTDEQRNAWQEKLHLYPEDQVLTLGSTHPKEEELLLPYLKNYKVLLVPRHPERFQSVKKLLQKINNPHIILVDQMGVLPICYQLSSVAIVGGSFVPEVGGHNIFEPIQAHIPVIFGPYMETQKELVETILQAKAGVQTSSENLLQALAIAQNLKTNVQALAKENRLIHANTQEILTKHFP